ncbi:ribonuclease H-like domain-containing protein [Tanacetum coccineum]
MPRPSDANIVCSIWLFKHKHFTNGSLSMYKAHLVTNRNSQQLGVDYDWTFNQVVKLDTIRIVFSLAASRHWHVHQLDIKNAFLPWNLMHGFRDLLDMLPVLVFPTTNVICPCSFINRIIASLHQEFPMIDLGTLNYFLGIFVTRTTKGMFLCQKKYAIEVLHRVGMCNYHSCMTLVDTESKFGADGTLVCLYMHDPRETHLAALNRILPYGRNTSDYGLQLYSSLTSSLVIYSDADWAGCLTTHCSTSGYYVSLGNNQLSWTIFEVDIDGFDEKPWRLQDILGVIVAAGACLSLVDYVVEASRISKNPSLVFP